MTIHDVTTALSFLVYFLTVCHCYTTGTRSSIPLPAIACGDALSALLFDAEPAAFMQLTLPRNKLVLVDAVDSLSEMLLFIDQILPATQPQPPPLQPATAPMCIGFDCEWEPEGYWRRKRNIAAASDTTNDGEESDATMDTIASTSSVGEEEVRPKKKSPPIPNNPALVLQIAFCDKIFVMDMQVLCRQPGTGRGFSLIDSSAPLTATELLVDQIFFKLFHRHDILKVGLGPQADLKRLFWSYPWLPSLCKVMGVVDIQTLAKTAYPAVKKRDLEGLSKLSQLELGLAVDKEQQCSHWERRPLTEEQLLYAGIDAWSLTLLFDSLCRKLQVASTGAVLVAGTDSTATKGKRKSRGHRGSELIEVIRTVTKDYSLALPQPLEDFLAIPADADEVEQGTVDGAGASPTTLLLPVLALRAVRMEEKNVPKNTGQHFVII